MNDPYMPLERKERLVECALRIILKYKFPLHITTKGSLVERDADLIRQIGEVYSAVSFSISTANDDLARKTEPGAPATSRRMAAMKFLADKGIYTGIVLCPVLPFISDTEENIRQIVELAIDHGASYILGWMGMTQREGQREHYYSELDRLFPGVRQQYVRTFSNNYECPSPSAEKLWQVFSEICDKLNMPLKMKFYEEHPPQQMFLFG